MSAPPGYYGSPPCNDGTAVATVGIEYPIQMQISSPYPCVIKCPHCHRQMSTNVEHKIGSTNHMMAFVFAVSLILLPCFFVPYCTNAFKDTVHSCSLCGQYIGTYDRSRRH